MTRDRAMSESERNRSGSLARMEVARIKVLAQKDAEDAEEDDDVEQELWRPSWAQAHGLMMLATCIYATWNVVNRQMGRGGTSKLAFVLYRQIGSAILLLIIQRVCIQKRDDPFVPLDVRQHIKRYIMLGGLMTSFQVFIMIGAAMTTASTLGVFQCAEPSIAAMLGFALGMEDKKTIWRRMISAASAAIGVLIVVALNDGGGGGHRREDEAGSVTYYFGCLILLFEGAQVAVYYLVQTKLLAEPINATPILVTTWSYVFATPFSIVVCFLNIAMYPVVEDELTSFSDLGNIFTNDDIKPMLGLTYAILFASIVGYWLWGVANQTLEASELILYQAVQLPITATLSVFLLGEQLHLPMVFGSVFIFGALVLKSPTLVPLACIDPPKTEGNETEFEADPKQPRSRAALRVEDPEENSLMAPQGIEDGIHDNL